MKGNQRVGPSSTWASLGKSLQLAVDIVWLFLYYVRVGRDEPCVYVCACVRSLARMPSCVLALCICVSVHRTCSIVYVYLRVCVRRYLRTYVCRLLCLVPLTQVITSSVTLTFAASSRRELQQWMASVRYASLLLKHKVGERQSAHTLRCT